MKPIFVFILFFSCSYFSEAQMVTVKEKTSGYLGKRFLLGADFSFSPSFNAQEASTSNESLFITLNKVYSVFGQFAIHNNLAAGFTVGSSATSANISDRIEGMSGFKNGIIVEDQYGTEYELRLINGKPKIEDLFFGVYGKSFLERSGGLAPIGRYVIYGLNVHTFSVDLSTVEFLGTEGSGWGGSSSYKTFKVKKPLSKKMLPEIFLGAGYASPLFGILVLDIGVKLGYMHPFVSEDINTYDIQNLLERAIYERLRNKQIINYNINLSYPF